MRTVSRSPRRPGPSRAPAAFTLVEVLVALVVLAAGVLALARAVTALERIERAAARRWAGAALLESGLERMRAAPCAPRAGADSAPGVVAGWSVTAGEAAATGVLADTARIERGGGDPPLVVGVRSAAPC